MPGRIRLTFLAVAVTLAVAPTPAFSAAGSVVPRYKVGGVDALLLPATDGGIWATTYTDNGGGGHDRKFAVHFASGGAPIGRVDLGFYGTDGLATAAAGSSEFRVLPDGTKWRVGPCDQSTSAGSLEFVAPDGSSRVLTTPSCTTWIDYLLQRETGGFWYSASFRTPGSVGSSGSSFGTISPAGTFDAVNGGGYYNEVAAAVDAQGNLWTTARQRTAPILVRLTPGGAPSMFAPRITTRSPKNSYYDKNIGSVIPEPSGGTWFVANDLELGQIDQAGKISPLWRSPYPLNSVSLGGDGRLWSTTAGCIHGKVAYYVTRLDPATHNFTFFAPSKTLYGNTVASRDGHIWWSSIGPERDAGGSHLAYVSEINPGSPPTSIASVKPCSKKDIGYP